MKKLMFVAVNVRVDEKTKVLFERRAKESGMNMSDYIRHCVLLESMIEGDIESFKAIAERMKEKVRIAVGKFAGV